MTVFMPSPIDLTNVEVLGSAQAPPVVGAGEAGNGPTQL